MTSGPKRFQCQGHEWGPGEGLDKCYWREKVPNWYKLAHCFSSGCGFTDVDFFFGMVERNSHFLFIEWKHPGAKLTDGQRIALRKLAALPECTVYVVEGDSVEMKIERWTNLAEAPSEIEKELEWRTDKTLEELCKRWWKWANKN